ncbi:MAG: MMPL family transporter [Dehalococcoidia bacterium]|nr:MMPL family transporter [Dehalococcoidia bacterium]MCB9484960.1 MMPL family transporter [Thermoflexaceae bacterium]
MEKKIVRPQSGLERWARFTYRHRGLVILGWFLGFVALVALAMTAGAPFQSNFTLPGSESQRGLDLLEARFPQRAGDLSDLVFEAPAGFDDPAVKAQVTRLVDEIAKLPSIVAVESPYDRADYIGESGTIARGVVRWDVQAPDVPTANIDAYVAVVDAANTDGFRVETGGRVVQLSEQEAFGSEALGLLAAVVILFVAFGSVVAMGLPIAAALFGIGVGTALVALLANVMGFPDFTAQFAAMIGIGVGIDYSLLVVTRFREGLHRGNSVEDAAAIAVATAGRSVIFAGTVVAIAFLGLIAMGLPAIGYLGVGSAVIVLVAVLVSITLMPALLSVVGRRVDSLKVPFLHQTEGVDRGSIWYRWSRMIQRKPLPYAIGAAVLLVTLAAPVLSMRLGFTDAGNNPTSYHTRRAYDLLTEGFGPGFNGPLVAVVDSTEDAAGEVATKVAEAARALPNVASVDDPVSNPAGDTAIVTIYPRTSPQDEQTSQLVHTLRNVALPAAIDGTGAEVSVTGFNAVDIDIQDRITSRMPFLFVGVIGLSFLLLMAVFRSVLVALKAALMNLLSIGAAYGVIVAVFQWGWGAGILGVDKGPIEPFLPMMFFAILFGLSMDYEVFLISRIREIYAHSGDNGTAVAEGLAATARVISAAAAIMVAVFLAFVLGDNRVVKVVGIGLATAIFVDSTVVRLLLVPATMELLGKANWWMPAWLGRIMPEIHLEAPETGFEDAPSPAGGR